MKLLGLPGRNPETEAWMGAITSSLKLGQSATEVAHYGHWDNGGDPDVPGEAARLAIGSGDVVIAKSMGTMVLLAAYRSGSAPARAVFIGTPISAYPEEARALLGEFASQIPSLFIQQNRDVTGTFADVAAVVGGAGLASMAEVEGEDHVYADTEMLSKLIEEWWGSHG